MEPNRPWRYIVKCVKEGTTFFIAGASLTQSLAKESALATDLAIAGWSCFPGRKLRCSVVRTRYMRRVGGSFGPAIGTA